MEYLDKGKTFLQKKTTKESTSISKNDIIPELDYVLGQPIQVLNSILNEELPEDQWDEKVSSFTFKPIQLLGLAIIKRKRAGENTSNIQNLLQKIEQLNCDKTELEKKITELIATNEEITKDCLQIQEAILEYSSYNTGPNILKVLQSLESDPSVCRRIDRIIRALTADLIQRQITPQKPSEITSQYQFVETSYDQKLEEIEKLLRDLDNQDPKNQQLAKQAISLAFTMNESVREARSNIEQLKKEKNENDQENVIIKEKIREILKDEATPDPIKNLDIIADKLAQYAKDSQASKEIQSQLIKDYQDQIQAEKEKVKKAEDSFNEKLLSERQKIAEEKKVKSPFKKFIIIMFIFQFIITYVLFKHFKTNTNLQSFVEEANATINSTIENVTDTLNETLNNTL